MDERILEQSALYSKKRIRRNRFRKLVSVLACIVVFCTTYALILPAITVERETFCGIEEHEHTLECYSDSQKDTETVSIWEASFGYELTGIWAEDLVAIAQSQIGYQESTENYQVEDGDTIQGYTRYGAWKEIPYADWNELFAAFCLHYAGLDEMFPAYTDVENGESWLQEFEKSEQFCLFAEDQLPNRGDLVILNDVNGDEASRIALVMRAIEATDASKAKIAVIEGDVDGRVDENYYELDGKWIYGYVSLPLQQFYCGLETHGHSELCYGEDGMLCCEQLEHTHEAICLQAIEAMEESTEQVTPTPAEQVTPIPTEQITPTPAEQVTPTPTEQITPTPTEQITPTPTEQVTPTPEEESGVESVGISKGFDGKTMYLHPKKWCYAESEHELCTNGANGQKDGSDALTFILTTESNEEWTPKPESGWTAKKDSNYIVTYCSDVDTRIDKTQEQSFVTYTIDNSRFTSEQQRQILAGIIAHSYPYITAEDMRKQILVGITDSNLQEGLKKCNEHEFIAATQWAIWETTMMGHEVLGVYSYYDDPCAGIVNLKETLFRSEGEDTENPNASNTYVSAIKDWLIKQAEAPDLAVDTCSYETSYDWKSGMYSLRVTASLNRAVKEGENAVYVLQAGDLSTQSVQMAAGEQAITMSISGLTREKLVSAQVKISVSGEHMQAYFFDSETQQDMIGGRWEEYIHEVSLDVDVETVDVSVNKIWSDSEENHSAVTVRLYADDTEYDNIVLNAENQWSYTWEDLPKKIDEAEVTYTVTEDPVVGYSGEKVVVHEDVKKNIWRALTKNDTLEDNAEYLLFSNFKNFKNNSEILVSNGALTWQNNVLSWSKADPTEDADETPASVVWKTESEGNGNIYLYHGGGNGYLSASDSTTCTLSTSKNSAKAFTYDKEKGYISYAEKDVTYYLAYITGGKLVAVTEEKNATNFTVYKKTEQSVKTKIIYTITNSKLPEDEWVSITIHKVDANTGNPLSGARFSLYQKAENSSGNSIIPNTNPVAWGVKHQDVTISEDGNAELVNLMVGQTYYLVETEAPEGYVLLPDAIEFSVSKKEDGTKEMQLNDSSVWVAANESLLGLTVKNQPGYALPATGGTGTFGYTIGGFAVFSAAAILLWIYKKRERGTLENRTSD